MIGSKMVQGQVKNASAAGLRVESQMALVITQRRLLTVKVGYTLGGAINGVKHVLGAIALDEIESIEAKRLGLGGVLIITPRGGQPIKLECQVGRARQFAEMFMRAAAPGHARAG
ncbi:MAG: hypothetical protein ACTHMY_17090 [Solirubrobacteraceae bacterium]